ncbi:MAG: hypothetical protein ACOCVK_01845 [bacterium]
MSKTPPPEDQRTLPDESSNPFTMTVTELSEVFAATPGTSALPPYEDAPAWAAAARSSTGRATRAVAERAVADGPSRIRARDYLRYWGEGDRLGFDALYRGRRQELVSLTLAELAEREGRFLPAIDDYLWAVSEETSWLLSAHIQHGMDTELPPRRTHYVDMDTAMTGVTLAEVLSVLGHRVHPEIRRRVTAEIRERLFEPYYFRHDLHWMHSDNNWNSAAHCGILGAACYLMSDPYELARIVQKGLSYLENFIGGFDEDGATSEGINCWQVGVGHLCVLDSIIGARSDGRLSLLRHVPRIEAIARFPERINLSYDTYANFSDAPKKFVPAPFVTARLRDVLGLDLVTFDNDSVRPSTYTMRSALVPQDELSSGYRDRPLDSYFRGVQWLISRTSPDDDALVLATKGGHNGEKHNHNDLGQFIVHLRGFSYLIDLGKPVFTRTSFTSDRYSILGNSSRGHSVPVVNGHEQGTGSRFAANVISRDEGQCSHIEYDLAGAYPREAGLARFTRRLELDRRGSGEVRIADAIELDGEGEVEHRYYCAVEPRRTDDGFELRSGHGGVVVTFDNARELGVDYLDDATTGSSAYRITRTQKGRHLVSALTVRPLDTGDVPDER